MIIKAAVLIIGDDQNIQVERLREEFAKLEVEVE